MKFTLVLSWLAWSAAAAQAGAFFNLDFEAADTSHVSKLFPGDPILRGGGNTKDLLPGWELSSSGVSREMLSYNAFAIGSGAQPEATILSSEAEFYYALGFLNGIRTGNYMFFVQTASTRMTLSQLGDIPAEATRLTFSLAKDSSSFSRTYLDGIPIVDGNISAFSGKENVRLTLEFGRVDGLGSFGITPHVAIDRIQFIPEPSTYALWLLGGCLLLVRRARGR
jgi:hypothetical protein